MPGIRREEIMNNNRGMLIALAAVVLFSMLGFGSAAAQGNGSLYEWTDDRGVVNVTDDLSKVPDKYRSRAKKLGSSGAGPAGQGAVSPQMPSPAEVVPGPAAQSDEDRKAQWQRRMRDAKQRLAAAEDRYRQLNQQKTNMTSQWGSSGASLPPQEVLDQMAQIDRDLERAKGDINDAKNMVEVIIPDEARKAGIPPGWLREVE
jgi:hypothetical protein